ncbi:hypothetical protein [Defluviimonas sp. SAOS-178_SWC]|uniref:hypothetical protein n=1 Tax=Defluviimonas sp. SAOS-178_SWC TaxID=3121287 RepID=UPI0032221894
MFQAFASSVWAHNLFFVLVLFAVLIILGKASERWLGKLEDRWEWHERKMSEIELSLLTEADFREALDEYTKMVLGKIEALTDRLEMLEEGLDGTSER